MNMPLRILYVEDSKTDIELVRETLSSAGLTFDLSTVDNQESYTTALVDGRQDIILSDYSLPRFDGFEALRRRNELSPQTPFILLSGTIGEERAASAIKNGSSDYVMKDNISKLDLVIRRALAERNEQQQRRIAEKNQGVLISILSLLNENRNKESTLTEILKVIKSYDRFDAVGVRLRRGNDFPFLHQIGFSDNFILQENSLRSNGQDARQDRLELACGFCSQVILGNRNILPSHFTPHGSFWTDDMDTLLQNVPASTCKGFRLTCHKVGYKSIAIIPFSADGLTIGVLLVCDRRQGMLSLERMNFLEQIAESIGVALKHQQYETLLRKNESHLRNAQRLAKVGSWEYDLTTGEMVWTEELFHILGIEPDQPDISFSSLLAAVHPDDRLLFDQCFTKLLIKGTPIGCELRFRLPDASEKTILAQAALYDGTSSTQLDVSHRSDAVVARGVFMDVTEHKDLLLQFYHAQKMETIGHLAGGIAHDFNNLLQIILGYGQILMKKLDKGNGASEAQEIDKAAHRAAALTRQLLIFSRKQKAEMKNVDLNSVIEDSEKMLRRVIGENIKLCVDLSHLPLMLKGDHGQLEQTLMNLVVNARDAMPDGGRLTIATSEVKLDSTRVGNLPDAREGRFARLIVTDTGVGMSKETRDRVFEPFFTTKGVGKGTGLGLAVVFGVVKEHNGWINVESELGAGTTFTIRLPLLEQVDTVADAAPDQFVPKAARSGRLLVVEDEEGIRSFMATTLKSVGHTVFEAGSTKAALRTLAEQGWNIDLVICDAILPDRGGADFLCEITDKMPHQKVILASGYTDEQSGHRVATERGWVFLQKPFSIMELQRVVDEMLQQPMPPEGTRDALLNLRS